MMEIYRQVWSCEIRIEFQEIFMLLVPSGRLGLSDFRCKEFTKIFSLKEFLRVENSLLRPQLKKSSR